MRILLVEDDELLGHGILIGLRQYGHAVDWIKDGTSALHALTGEDKFDAVVLDLGLPKKDGLEVLKEARAAGCQFPILLLTARGTTDDRITGLDSGADDYLTKPFDLDELYARLRALQRRFADRTVPLIVHGNLTLDPAAHTITQNGALVTLSRREFVLIQKLLENAGHIASREALTQCLYGWDEDIDSNALEVHIHNLRKKFGSSFIRTVRGVGYMIDKPEA